MVKEEELRVLRMLGLAIISIFIVMGLSSRGCAEAYAKASVEAYRVMMCESKMVHNTWGDLDYPHHAYGIAQFQERTFTWMKEMAGRPELHWKNKKDQIWLLEWAIENDYGKYWTCYRKLYMDGRPLNG